MAKRNAATAAYADTSEDELHQIQDPFNGVDDEEYDRQSLLEQLVHAEGQLRRIRDQGAARSRRYRRKLNERKAQAAEEARRIRE